MKGPVFPLLLVIFISGCAVGPNYKKPAINTPTVYRGLTPDEAGKTDTKSLADEKWWEVFQDEQLKELINRITMSAVPQVAFSRLKHSSASRVPISFPQSPARRQP